MTYWCDDITRETPASFEPSIDYVVTKIPRFAFEKFPQADPTLTTQMKSVGEAMKSPVCSGDANHCAHFSPCVQFTVLAWNAQYCWSPSRRISKQQQQRTLTGQPNSINLLTSRSTAGVLPM
jgi:hypothetical protein